MTNTTTAMANGKPLHFNVGDKVRHCSDVENPIKGWDVYGVGEVRAILFDKSGGFNYYDVRFPTAHGRWITQYNYWDLVKVES